jgi:hypothetical protein
VSTYYNGWKGLKVTAILEWGEKAARRAATRPQRAAGGLRTLSVTRAAALARSRSMRRRH